jgi:hypothetical protein
MVAWFLFGGVTFAMAVLLLSQIAPANLGKPMTRLALTYNFSFQAA